MEVRSARQSRFSHGHSGQGPQHSSLAPSHVSRPCSSSHAGIVAVCRGPHPPTVDNAKRQQAWDEPCSHKVAGDLLERASNDYTRARLLANQQETSGAWLEALPITSVGLRMADDVIRVAVGVRHGVNLCHPHVCVCGHQVDARVTHGLACQRSAGRHPRHGLLNDVIWRALQRAKIPAAKEPTGLTRTDGKRPNGVTMVPWAWARGRCMAWDVTVPDTLAPSRV